MNSLEVLFTKFKEEETLIILQNKDHVPVGSLNFKECNLDNFVILELNTGHPEKYAISISGLTILFSYFIKK